MEGFSFIKVIYLIVSMVASSAMSAVIGALLLMLACRIVVRFTPKYGRAWLLSFLSGIMICLTFGIIFLVMWTTELAPEKSQLQSFYFGGLLLGLTLHATVLGRLLKEPDNSKPIGFSKAMLVNLTQIGFLLVASLALAGVIVGIKQLQ